MPIDKPTRDQALGLLRQYNQSEALIRHALAVEAVMRHLASRYGEDEDLWGVVGLVHDLDYEQFPDQHCTKKKWKEKSFAAGVNREVIEKGAQRQSEASATGTVATQTVDRITCHTKIQHSESTF